MADDKNTKNTASDLRARVEAKAKTRKFNPTHVSGRAALFDANSYGQDYTVGGFLKPKWVREEDARIEQQRAQGYMKPSEWDPSLKDRSQGGLVLMLTEAENVKSREDFIEALARQQDATKGKDPTGELEKAGREVGQKAVQVETGKENVAYKYKTPGGPAPVTAD